MLTQSSPELTSTTWSPVTARPTCAPRCRHPGSFAARGWWPWRSGSSSVGRPGSPSRRTSRSLSLNDGISDVPSSGNNARPTTTAAAAVMSAALGLWTTRDIAPRYRGSQRPQQRRLTASGRSPREEHQAQRGAERQRDEHGRRHRQGIGERERLEERAGPTLHDGEGTTARSAINVRTPTGSASRAMPAGQRRRSTRRARRLVARAGASRRSRR